MSDFVTTPPQVAENTNITYSEFEVWRAESLANPLAFWANAARRELTWIKDFTITQSGDFNPPVKIEWFADGVLNVSANCLDRHLATHGDKTAIIWEGDTLGEVRRYTYAELAKAVNRWANLLKYFGVQKGDVVIIYLPMIPEASMAMLACARIGAVHSVVFGGFSAQALRDRINDSGAKLVITADEGLPRRQNHAAKSHG